MHSARGCNPTRLRRAARPAQVRTAASAARGASLKEPTTTSRRSPAWPTPSTSPTDSRSHRRRPPRLAPTLTLPLPRPLSLTPTPIPNPNPHSTPNQACPTALVEAIDGPNQMLSGGYAAV
eukprot:scaffold1087_cov64-Phaeocystis_antarctica.AAC.6